MNLDLDRALQRLAAEPAHPGLSVLEAAVLARLASDARNVFALSGSFVAAAAIFAASLGLASTGMAASAVRAAPLLSPFGPSTPLAPSTLLADAP